MRNENIFLYVNYTPDDNTIGISKKIKAQIYSLRNMGFKVTYTGYIDNGVAIFNDKDEIVYRISFNVKNKKYQRLMRRFLLIKIAKKYIISTEKIYEYCYMRWHAFDSAFIKLLKKIKKHGSTIIVEAHAYTPQKKTTNMFDLYSNTVDKIYSNKAKKYVDLVAGISEFDNIWGIPTVKIENGVAVDNLPIRNWKKNNDVIRLLCVANEKKYHGYDRLIRSLYNYKKNNDGDKRVEIKLVGEYLSSTKKLVEELNLTNEVTYFGKKSGKELIDIYNRSDMGIGALAHHRIGMYSGSSLKTKEYFAMGLPFVYGWEEPSFDASYPYVLKVELNEEPIDFYEIINFNKKIEQYPNMIQDMRTFAINNFSWQAQFLKIFNVLEKDL